MSSTLKVGDALKNPGQAYAFQADAELEEMEVLSDPVRFSQIGIVGEFAGAGETVSVRARVTAKVESRCAKCLSPVETRIDAEMDALFSRAPDPEDPDQYAFEGSALDLTEAAKDALLLELPLRFLCGEDCKGLCPICGKNLNEGSCACPRGGEVTNPFAALKSIVHNDEEV